MNYEIDLTEENAAALEEAFAKYVGAARRVSGRAAAGRGRTTRTTVSSDPKTVRAWAAGNGIVASARGRIHADVVKQFEAANAA